MSFVSSLSRDIPLEWKSVEVQHRTWSVFYGFKTYLPPLPPFSAL
jgi:hypothetical protein